MPRLPTAVLLLLAGCASQPAPHFPRPALPLPAATAEHYALPGPVRVLDCTATRADGTCHRGHLRSGDEVAEFQLLRPDAGGRARLVLLVPILAGGDVLLQIAADHLLAQGFAVAFCSRAGSALRPPQRGPELEQLFRRTVVHQRMLLRYCRDSGLCDAAAPLVLGMSLGGMVATVLAAVEPGIAGTTVCVSGGDLPDLLLHSAESRVQQWVDWRGRADGLAGRMLADELRAHLTSDPMRLAAFVPTDRVFLVEATFDEVIPERNRDLLWEALGRPQRLQLPLGHYSVALAIGPILRAAGDFFRSRLPASSTRSAAVPPATGS